MKIALPLFLFFVFALSESKSYAQQNDDISYNFSLLRQRDDVSFLKDKQNKSFYEKVKYKSISESSFLSFGGSLRSQIEYFNNESFVEDASDAWILNRLMVHSKFQINENLYVFGELLSGFINSKTMPSPVDRDEITVNQLFIDYQKNNIAITIGRVNPTFGANRIIALREGPNVRRYFDGVKGGYNSKDISLQGFYYQPVAINPYGFDNDALDGDEYLYGAYGTVRANAKVHNLDYYYIGRHIDNFVYTAGTGTEDRHSIGLRYYGTRKNLSYDLEGLYQFGKFNDLHIQAWTLSLKTNYIIPLNEDSALNFGLKTEYISGDDNPNDNKLKTFNALYPRGAYFGRVAQFGPMNLVDVHPSIQYSYKKWYAIADYVAFWRASDDDAVYGAGLNISFPDVNDDKFIGHQYGGVIGYVVNSFISFEVEANYIQSGEFLNNSNLNNNLFHFVSTLQFNF